MKFTVYGGEGFVGSHLCAHLRARGHEVVVPPRDHVAHSSGEAGHVIYAIGLTGDFRIRPLAAVEAHVCLLSRLLSQVRYDSWLYVSSTRVYDGMDPTAPATEDMPLSATPSLSGLYNLSKLLGEAICLSLDSPRVRVARLANVYGPGQARHGFLGALLGELNERGTMTIREAPDSAKDYISAAEAARLLAAIALDGQQRLYNVASGRATRHGELAEAIEALTKARVTFAPGAPTRTFPPADVSRVRHEFGVGGTSILDDLPRLLENDPGAHHP